jgi:uncharacterized protein
LPQDIFIAGASARAAAFSALRAGLRPCCVDLFADADLQAICQVVRIPGDRYPSGIAEVADRFPSGPWLFTGAIENRPDVIRVISQKRPLWGCSLDSIEKARSPGKLHELVSQAGIRSPRALLPGERIPTDRNWLIKPIAGAAGFGIHETVASESCEVPANCYGQEYVEGRSCSGLFVGHDSGCVFLGVTVQLIGPPWVHAAPFHYAGSVGPIPLSSASSQQFRVIGDLLTHRFGLRGIFGVDCILQDEVPWVIEVNPRYTASVEVWEYAFKSSALALHRLAFEGLNDVAGQRLQGMKLSTPSKTVVGKAILYARETVTIPTPTPWSTVETVDPAGFDPPAFADLPSAGDQIERGHPILTFFAERSSLDDCLQKLEQRAKSLDHWLYRDSKSEGI